MNDTPNPRKNRTALWIVLAVIAALLFACVAMAVAGVVGYAVGRSAARSTGPVVEQRVERVPRPDVVPVPEMPGMPGMASGWALVLEVTEGSPADRAGLRAGDFVVSVEGESLRDEVALADLIRQYEPGAEVELVVWRDGRERHVTVTLGSNPENDAAPWLGVTYRQVPGGPTMHYEVPPVREQLRPFSG